VAKQANPAGRVGQAALLVIRAAGQVTVYGGSAASSYTSLANISFPVASTKCDGVVYFTGAMYQNSGVARWPFVAR
jgi:hypothetical protein